MDSEHPNERPLWYETNLFWGSLSLASGIVLAVVGAIKHDLRWILSVAWVLFTLSVFAYARGRRHVVIITIVGCVFLGGLMAWTATVLSPKTVSTEEPYKADLAPSSHAVEPPAQLPLPSSIAQPKAKISIRTVRPIIPVVGNGRRAIVSQNNDHGIINNGPVSGSNQVVEDNRQYGVPRPPPAIVGLSQAAVLGDPRRTVIEGQVANYSGLMLSFSLDAAFVNPAFLVRCDHPCVATLVAWPNALIMNYEGLYSPNDPNVTGIIPGTSLPIPPNVAVTIWVRSRDTIAIQSATVESYVQPLK